MNIEDDKKGPAVRFPPPLIFLFLLLLAFVIHLFRPVGIGSSSGVRYLGLLIVALGLLPIILVNRSFKRANTRIEPWQPTTSIVTSGIFGFSRNPVYVGFSLITIGIGVLLNSFWVLASFLPAAILVYYVAIRKEEAYLEDKFGEEYVRYKSVVRRWL